MENVANRVKLPLPIASPKFIKKSASARRKANTYICG